MTEFIQDKLPRTLKVIWYQFTLAPGELILDEEIAPPIYDGEPHHNVRCRARMNVNRLKEALPTVEIVRIQGTGYVYVPGSVPNPQTNIPTTTATIYEVFREFVVDNEIFSKMSCKVGAFFEVRWKHDNS